MQRYTDWAQRLTSFIQNRRNTPFSWGKHDCCMFAADAVIAITGYDYAEVFRHRYTTELGAYRVLKREGFSGVEEVLTGLLGEASPRLAACRGDVVLIEHNGSDTAGIMFGDVVVPGISKLETLSPLAIKKVWRIA